MKRSPGTASASYATLRSDLACPRGPGRRPASRRDELPGQPRSGFGHRQPRDRQSALVQQTVAAEQKTLSHWHRHPGSCHAPSSAMARESRL
jgi:hypothetical protein